MSDTDPLSQPQRLLTLLSLQSTQPTWQSDELGAILAHQLNAPLAEALPDVGSDGAKWKNLRQLLLDPSAPAHWLARIKDFAKAASVSGETGLPRDVATVLYLAS